MSYIAYLLLQPESSFKKTALKNFSEELSRRELEEKLEKALEEKNGR